MFGKDAKHLFVLTGAGVIESTDGGETWSKPIALPKELKGVGGLTWIEYDPQGDTALRHEDGQRPVQAAARAIREEYPRAADSSDWLARRRLLGLSSTRLADRLDVPLIRSAAPAEHVEVRRAACGGRRYCVPSSAGLPMSSSVACRARRGSWSRRWRGGRGCVTSTRAPAGERAGEVRRMGAVDHVVGGCAAVARRPASIASRERLPVRQACRRSRR